MDKNFNIVIAGVGGQGVITLNNIIANAAMIEGYDVRTSELHGLSQRSGSVQTYIRMGEKIYSPLITEGKADLVLALEITEGLRAVFYKNAKTNYIINNHYLYFTDNLSEKEILEKIKRLDFFLVSASEICKKELENEVVSAIYILGVAVFKKMIPLKPESVLKTIEKIIPQKYLELNKKAFELAKT